MALGAGRGSVVGLVLRHGLMLTGSGIAIGLLTAAVFSRSIASLLYGVRPFDPITFIGVPVFLLVAASIACLVPAWKAARIDPIDALRQE
jgi:ABC-type antimicrobial peptide transport system permease subunit